MEVDSALYQVFYEKLCRSVIKKEYNGTKPKNLRKETGRLIWTVFTKERFLKFFPSQGLVSREYFYVRQQISIHKDPVEIDDRILVSAFRYLSLPIQIMKGLQNHPGIKDKAIYLCAEFKKINSSEIEEKRADALSATRATTATPDLEKDIEAALMRSAHRTNQENLGVKKNSPHFLSVAVVIQKYFENLTSRNFGLAWGLLSSKAKRRCWDDDFDLFVEYQMTNTNVHKIRNYGFGHRYESVMCSVVLKCSSVPKEFQEYDFQNSTIANVKSFAKDVDRFIKTVDDFHKASEEQKEMFRKTPLRHLFQTPYFMYDKNTSAKEFFHIINSGDLPHAFVFCQIQCVFEGDWRINEIYQDSSTIRKLLQKRKLMQNR